MLVSEGFLPSLLSSKFFMTGSPLLGRFLVGLTVGGLATVASLKSLLHLGAASLITIYVGFCLISLYLRYFDTISGKNSSIPNIQRDAFIRSLLWMRRKKQMTSCLQSVLKCCRNERDDAGPLLDIIDDDEIVHHDSGQYTSETTVSDNEEDDIDTVVREYHISTISKPSRNPSQLLQNPTKKSRLTVLVAVVTIMVCFSFQSFLICYFDETLVKLAGIFTSVSITTLLLMFLISRQPMTIRGLRAPPAGSPWVQCSALACLLSLIFPFIFDLPLIFSWLLVGLLLSQGGISRKENFHPTPSQLQTLTLAGLNSNPSF